MFAPLTRSTDPTTRPGIDQAKETDRELDRARHSKLMNRSACNELTFRCSILSQVAASHERDLCATVLSGAAACSNGASQQPADSDGFGSRLQPVQRGSLAMLMDHGGLAPVTKFKRGTAVADHWSPGDHHVVPTACVGLGQIGHSQPSQSRNQPANKAATRAATSPHGSRTAGACGQADEVRVEQRSINLVAPANVGAHNREIYRRGKV